MPFSPRGHLSPQGIIVPAALCELVPRHDSALEVGRPLWGQAVLKRESAEVAGPFDPLERTLWRFFGVWNGKETPENGPILRFYSAWGASGLST